MPSTRGDCGTQAQRIERGNTLLPRLEAMPVTTVAFFARAGVHSLALFYLRHGRPVSTSTLDVIEATLAQLDAEGAETFTAKAERCAQFTALAEQRSRGRPVVAHAADGRTQD